MAAFQEFSFHLLEYVRRSARWVPVFVCVTDYVGTVSAVSGRSMQPTFNPRWPDSSDVVVLDKWSVRQRKYGRGDVVVLQSPTAPQELLTKRVLGLGGDWVYRRGSKRDMLHVRCSASLTARPPLDSARAAPLRRCLLATCGSRATTLTTAMTATASALCPLAW